MKTLSIFSLLLLTGCFNTVRIQHYHFLDPTENRNQMVSNCVVDFRGLMVEGDLPVLPYDDRLLIESLSREIVRLRRVIVNNETVANRVKEKLGRCGIEVKVDD